jgi:hypothetical protein
LCAYVDESSLPGPKHPTVQRMRGYASLHADFVRLRGTEFCAAMRTMDGSRGELHSEIGLVALECTQVRDVQQFLNSVAQVN